MSIPVISGIGHDIDNTITDIVAHTSLKTPTAVADFLIDNLVEFESDVIGIFSQIEKNKLELTKSRISNLVKNTFSKQKTYLEMTEKVLRGYNLDNVLKRGFAYTSQNGNIVTKKKDINHKYNNT